MPVIPAARLRLLAKHVMQRLGSAPAEAELVARHLVRANLTGHDSHGVGALAWYVPRIRGGHAVLNQTLRTLVDEGAMLLFDADRGLGQRMAEQATRAAMARAAALGACVMGLRNSFHIGRVGAYGEIAAEAGMAFLGFVNVADHTCLQAPFGASEGRLGTNPFCLSVPGADGPALLLDAATTMIAAGKTRVALEHGKPVPAGALLDAEGNPTTDPAGFVHDRHGALVSFGLHKGSGLAVLCEALGAVLTGGQRGDEPQHGGVLNSMLAVLIDTRRFASPASFAAGLEALAGNIHGARRAAGVTEVLLPGEPERQAAAVRGVRGVAIPGAEWDNLLRIARELGGPKPSLRVRRPDGHAILSCNNKAREHTMKTDRTAIAARRFSRRMLLKAAAASVALPVAAHAQKPTKVTVWTWGGTERFNRRVIAFQRQFPQAAARIDVEVVSPGQHDPEVYQAFRLALASGKNVPDVMQMNYTALPEFAEAGVLADLGGMMKPYAADLTEGARKLASYNDTTFAIPYQMKGKSWFYRKDLFEQAGIDPAAVKSFDDYMAAGRRFREKLPKSYIMNFGRSPIFYWYFEVLSNWADMRVAGRDGKFHITSDPRFGTLIDWFKAFRTSGIAFDADDFAPTWQPAFADGSIGGALISNWMTDFLPKFAPAQSGRWGISVWPEFSRGGSEGGGAIMTIPEASKNKQAAFEFCADAFLTKAGSLGEWERTGTPTVLKSAQQEMLDLSAHLTRPADMPDAVWAALPTNYFGSDFLRPVLRAFEDFRPFAYDPAAQAELDIMRRETEAYMAGTKTREQALEAMQATMTTQISNPYRT